MIVGRLPSVEFTLNNDPLFKARSGFLSAPLDGPREAPGRTRGPAETKGRATKRMLLRSMLKVLIVLEGC